MNNLINLNKSTRTSNHYMPINQIIYFNNFLFIYLIMYFKNRKIAINLRLILSIFLYPLLHKNSLHRIKTKNKSPF